MLNQVLIHLLEQVLITLKVENFKSGTSHSRKELFVDDEH